MDINLLICSLKLLGFSVFTKLLNKIRMLNIYSPMSNQKDHDIVTKDQDSVAKDPNKALTTTAILRGSVKKQGKNAASNHMTSHCINEIISKK